MQQQTIIDIRNLTVQRDQTILKDVSWQVKEGEHWAIVGPNGSGKTTLLSVLNAYTAPTEGRISFAESEYGKKDWRIVRKKIGMVSSHLNHRIASSSTPLDVILSGKNALLRKPNDCDAFDYEKAILILNGIEMQDLGDREWFKLSQGEKQRLLIGRALIAQHQVLILDEPCAGLDPVARESFLIFIERLMSENKTTTLVMVTHHVEEIVSSITHVLLIKHGTVVAAGLKNAVVTTDNFSNAFEMPVEITCVGDRYAMQVTIQKDKIM